jgi:hypothetical protein
MNELNNYIKKTNWYLLHEYFIDVRGDIESNNIVFNWYFESFSNNETFQTCAGKVANYLTKGLSKK